MTDARLQGEFYVFIVGIYAASHDIAVTGYSVQSADADAGTMGRAVNCFNLEGNRFNGTAFTQVQVSGPYPPVP